MQHEGPYAIHKKSFRGFWGWSHIKVGLGEIGGEEEETSIKGESPIPKVSKSVVLCASAHFIPLPTL